VTSGGRPVARGRGPYQRCGQRGKRPADGPRDRETDAGTARDRDANGRLWGETAAP